MQYFDTSKNQSPGPWIHELFIPWIKGKHTDWQHGLELIFRTNEQQAAATAIYTSDIANNSGGRMRKIDIYVLLLIRHEPTTNFWRELHKFHILEWDPIGCADMSEKEPSCTFRLWKWGNYVFAKRREPISQWQCHETSVTQLRGIYIYI